MAAASDVSIYAKSLRSSIATVSFSPMPSERRPPATRAARCCSSVEESVRSPEISNLVSISACVGTPATAPSFLLSVGVGVDEIPCLVLGRPDDDFGVGVAELVDVVGLDVLELGEHEP